MKGRLLITGGAGLLGKEVRDVFRPDHEVLSVDIRECDVTSAIACRGTIGAFRPDVVIHCAAYTAVDKAESEEAAAFAVNAEGTRNVARECRARGVLLVAFGSDYIFDGKSGRPYVEEDAARPLSAYGRSKWAAEEAIREAAPDHILVRTQWLFGPHGRNFVFAILDRARRGEPLRVVSDQRGSPTYALDLARATRRLMEAGARGTVHFSNEGEATWHEFAAFVLGRACPDEVALSPCRSADLGYPAPRPAYSVLSKEKYRRVTGESPRPWREAVIDFLGRTFEGGVAW